MNKLIAILTLLAAPLFTLAEDGVEMASVMHENGKIYVVVAVLSIVFAGIVFYLVRIDQKVSKLEKELKK